MCDACIMPLSERAGLDFLVHPGAEQLQIRILKVISNLASRMVPGHMDVVAQDDMPAVRLEDPAEQFRQRAFPGPVLTGQNVKFSGLQQH